MSSTWRSVLRSLCKSGWSRSADKIRLNSAETGKFCENHPKPALSQDTILESTTSGKKSLSESDDPKVVKISPEVFDKLKQVEIIKELQAKIKEAEETKATLLLEQQAWQDKYKFALAEGENLRNSVTQKVEQAEAQAIEEFSRELVEVSDILRLSIESFPPSQHLNQPGDITHERLLHGGMTVIETKLFQIFRKHGLEEINPHNEKFNPAEHEAVVHQHVPGVEAGGIIFVCHLGFKFNDKVLRKAAVGVYSSEVE